MAMVLLEIEHVKARQRQGTRTDLGKEVTLLSSDNKVQEGKAIEIPRFLESQYSFRELRENQIIHYLLLARKQ